MQDVALGTVLHFPETAGWDGWVIIRVGNFPMREMFIGKQASYRVKIKRTASSRPGKICHVQHPFIAVRRHGLLRITVDREETGKLVPLTRIGKWTGKPLTFDWLRILPLVLCRRVRWI